ncbi:MAG: ribbon-helix-helix protein, CopG family [Syntrophobacteraceae bacterium]|nr:ribbon-helix-helix protein, CopG family [Syntrophobacteraceae bacterium]
MATTMGVKLDEETCERLKSLGMLKRRSTHWLMREAIREYLNKEEAAEARNREADEAWETYQRTGEFVTNEAMTAWFDTWGTSEEGPEPETECRR